MFFRVRDQNVYVSEGKFVNVLIAPSLHIFPTGTRYENFRGDLIPCFLLIGHKHQREPKIKEGHRQQDYLTSLRHKN
jgi:hypothetical protein